MTLVYRLYDGREQEEFEYSLQQLIESIINMMMNTSDSTLTVQAACLKFLPSAIPDILAVFSATKLR